MESIATSCPQLQGEYPGQLLAIIDKKGETGHPGKAQRLEQVHLHRALNCGQLAPYNFAVVEPDFRARLQLQFKKVDMIDFPVESTDGAEYREAITPRLTSIC